MVAAGSTLVLALSTQTTLTQGTTDVVSAVTGLLAGQGISVLDSEITTPDFLNQLGIAALSSFDQPFQVNLTIKVSSAYSGDDDPLSIVENAFYQVTGSYPISGSTVSVAGAATGEPGLGTSATAPGSSGSGVPAVNGQGFTAVITNAVDKIVSESNWLVVALVGIVILVLVLVAFSPNTGAIARAVTI